MSFLFKILEKLFGVFPPFFRKMLHYMACNFTCDGPRSDRFGTHRPCMLVIMIKTWIHTLTICKTYTKL